MSPLKQKNLMQAYLKSSILTEIGYSNTGNSNITIEQHEHTQEFNPLHYTGSARVLQASSLEAHQSVQS